MSILFGSKHRVKAESSLLIVCRMLMMGDVGMTISIPEADLRDFATDRLARYKQPRAYVYLEALPTGANGKLLRRALPAYFKG